MISGVLLARTGIPVQLGQTGTGLNVSRPDYIGGQVKFDDYKTTLRYLNPAAFALVPISPVSRIAVRPGNVGNNAIREPGSVNLNTSLSKEFSFTEKLRFRTGVDAFNFFNHTQFLNPIGTQNAVTFGRVTATADPRIMQIAGRLQW